MSKFKVYISSTFLDMESLRKRILDLIHFHLNEWIGFTELMEMMHNNIANRSDIDVCLKNVRAADVYIILQGKRYGSAPEQYSNNSNEIIQNTKNRSYTWLEYEAACEIEKVKRIDIYKIQLTDEFFKNEGLDAQSDLDDENKKKLYNEFCEELKKPKSPDPINSIQDLDKQIGLLIIKSQLKFNTIAQLGLTEEHLCSINRQQQVKFLEKENLDPQSSVACLVINSKDHEEDKVVVFSRKIRQIFRPKEIAEILRNLEFVNLNILSGSASEEMDKIRTKILIESSPNILGTRASRVSFDTLYKEIEKRDIQNCFLGYQIDLRIQSDKTVTLIRYLQDFIQYLNKFLNDNQYIYNFFVILSIVTEDDLSGKFIQKYMPGLDTHVYDLQRLSDVKLKDIQDWLDMIISSKNARYIADFNLIRDDIIKQIFIDTGLFPKTYKQCLDDIESRVK